VKAEHVVAVVALYASGLVGAETNAWQAVNLLKNSTFIRGLEYWQPWQAAKHDSNIVCVVTYEGTRGKYRALRIENPGGVLAGVQQLVSLKSGEVYRLSAACRSSITNDSHQLFGGRVAVYQPPQAEEQLVWTTEFNNWWKRERIITAQMSSVAVVLVHLGYGRVATTGEFADVRLEQLQRGGGGTQR